MSGYSKSQTLGGTGGAPFSDDLTLSSRLAGIVINTGEYVDGIQGIYQTCGGTTFPGPWHGGTGGAKTTITFHADEFITGVKVRAGQYVDQLTFYTNLKPTGYGPFGGPGGAETNLAIGVGGFFGTSGEYLDQVGFFVPCK